VYELEILCTNTAQAPAPAPTPTPTLTHIHYVVLPSTPPNFISVLKFLQFTALHFECLKDDQQGRTTTVELVYQVLVVEELIVMASGKWHVCTTTYLWYVHIDIDPASS
ncbi:unnamed protein product, partial [Ceratitis capitata]